MSLVQELDGSGLHFITILRTFREISSHSTKPRHESESEQPEHCVQGMAGMALLFSAGFKVQFELFK